MKISQDSKPVPKVTYASLGALIVSVVITIFLRFGWTYDQAVQITPAVIDIVYVLGPPLAAFIFGYMKPDPDRDRLILERDQAEQTLQTYLSQIRQPQQ